jgi:hypothetical protein
MFEWRDFLLVEGGPDRDRKVAGGIQHQAAALVAGLQAASTGGLYSSDATKLKFTGPSCDVNSLIRRGTKTRAGQDAYQVAAPTEREHPPSTERISLTKECG